MELRDYQQVLYDKTQQAFRDGFRKPLIVAPCGAGKSYVFAEMVRQASKKGSILILIHRLELKEQHTKLFHDLDIPMDNIRIQMVFTEASRLGKYPKPGLLILDEAHLSRANSWTKVVDYYDTYTIGFTATPCRLDNRPLGDIYDTLIEGPSVKWLIENKCLSPYEYFAPTLVDVNSFKRRAGDFAQEDIEPLMMDKAIYGNVIDTYKKLVNGKKAIAYCVSIKHSMEVAEAFNNAGIPAVHIDGKTPEKQRKTALKDFRSGKVKILCNCSIIAEGVSVNDCDCCMMLRPTDSLALYIQSSMRCMRYMPGKTATILDFVGNYTRHGFPDDDREWSLEKPAERRNEFNDMGEYTVRQCPECFKTFKTASVCPYCGYEYIPQGRELKQMQEIELKRITEEEKAEEEKRKKAARMEVGMARSYEDLWNIAKARGYSRGWIFKMAKIKGIKA